MDIADIDNQYQLGLSILSGIYSFIMVGLGIWKQKQYLRIAAIVLFGVVLLKLFLFDLAHLSTISKTVVFIVLGLILLVISFMYNKYNNKITNEN